MTRMVHCVKLGQELPGMKVQLYEDALGDKIFNSISQEAWNMWLQHKTMLINHHGLVLADPKVRAILRQEMEEFFFGDNDAKPEGWTPPEEGQG